MTALPTTVGDTNTQPCVSKRQSACHGFAASAADGGSSARIDGRCRNSNTATTTKDRLRIKPRDGCSAIVSRSETAQRMREVPSARRSEMLLESDELCLRNDGIDGHGK